MSDVVAGDSQDVSGEGLQPLYKAYSRQKCFIGYSERAPWAEDLLTACEQVLQEPAFDLEADYARKHLYPDTPLREKALELIANARYGIYDLSQWRDPDDPSGQWFLPRNVFIELGMAVALNRPVLLLRHKANVGAALELPKCVQNWPIVEWAGDITLKETLRQVLPQWIRQDPADAWRQRHCNIGGRLCEHRESHPRARKWVDDALRCHIADGQDTDQTDFRAGIETELNRFALVEFEYLDDLPQAEGYSFLLCSHCQSVRSNRFGIYRITPQTAAETYLAIGMTFGLEKQYGYRILKLVFAETAEKVPSLLAGYEVVTAQNNRERTQKLSHFMSSVINQMRQMDWRPSPLPFISTTDADEDGLRLVVEQEEGEVLTEATADPGDVAPAENDATSAQEVDNQGQSQATAPPTCPACGTINRAGAGFCANCGTDLNVNRTAGGLLASGTILQQRYQVVRLISATGGTSLVYEVKDLTDSPPTTWALKEFRYGAGSQDKLEMRIYFDQEADWFRTLSHRNILRFHDRFEENGRVYLVLEYCDGQALEDVLRRRGGPITEQEVLTWAVQICDALEYLHTRNLPVIYRNVKPGSLMVASDGTLKIVDFGIARTYKIGKATDTVFMGTESYASPEQYGTAQTDARSDVYSLGATMYHLLTNQHPPYARLPDDPPQVRNHNPQVSRQTSDIVAKAMQKDRSQRYQSAAEMRQAIAAVGQAPVVPSQTSADVSTAGAMACATCGTINRPNSWFCATCGAALTPPAPQPSAGDRAVGELCTNCGAINSPGTTFCHTCGTPLAAAQTSDTSYVASASTSWSSELSFGTVLQGRYRIVRKIGQGGISSVYEVHDSRTNRTYALKKLENYQTLPAEWAEELKQFEQQMKILSSLNHQGIPQVIDYFVENGNWFLVMQLAPGRTLQHIADSSSLPLELGMVTEVALQVCDILQHLHSRNPSIIHRDVKPQTIVLEQSGMIWLIGFGIARFYVPGLAMDESPLGTAGFAPPEQYGRAQTDARSDVYALGATMHYLLSGSDPAKDPFNFHELSALNPLIPKAVSLIVHRSLELSPSARFQSAREMQLALLDVRKGRAVSPSLREGGPRPQPRRWPWQRSGGTES